MGGCFTSLAQPFGQVPVIEDNDFRLYGKNLDILSFPVLVPNISYLYYI